MGASCARDISEKTLTSINENQSQNRKLNNPAQIFLLVDKQPRKWYAKQNIYVEVVNLSKAKYPNRDALRKAHDIYLDAIYPFVNKCLDKFQDTTVIAGKIEISDVAHLVRTYWHNYFEDQFKVIDPYYEARSAIGLIVEGRNRAAHPPWDLDLEFTRAQLFLIAEVLGKIKRSDAQREVEIIRDKLFKDTTEQRVTVEAKTEKAKYEKSIAEVEERLSAAEESKKKLSKQIIDNAVKLDEKKEELEELAGKFLNVRNRKDDYKNQYTSKSKELAKVQEQLKDAQNEVKKIETERDTSVERLADVSNELASTQAKKNAAAEHLTTAKNLINIVSNQLVYPPLETDSTVRILDRRDIMDKRNYLLNLLEQKQPTIIYVQSEERIDQLLALVGPEKADVIGKCNERTSEAEEAEIFGKLESGELIAVVSNTAFSTLAPSHCVEHFVFCHLVPGLDEFFEQCRPAFTSKKNVYLHLIYNSEQDIEGLAQKYPDREALVEMYRELEKLAGVNGDFIRTGSLYSALDMTKLGIEIGLAIFEELQLLECNDESIRLLPPVGNKLDESEIYRRGEKLKKETADFQAFQLERSVEQIWEETLAKLGVDSEQILRERNTHNYGAKDEVSIPHIFQDALENAETQSEQSTEAVESDSAASDADTEASQVVEPARANAKVTEKQVREIRSRRADSELNSELAEEDNEKKPEVKQSEFWQPVRAGELGALFAGKPVPVGDDGWISKRIRGVELILSFRKNRSYVSFLCRGENRIERRDKIIALFPETDYDYSPHESPQRSGFRFPVINKGKDHPEDWDEIRKKLVAMGTDIYDKIDESAL